MYLLPLLLAAILPAASLARMHRSPQYYSEKHRNVARATKYKLQDKHQGKTFFDEWDFFSAPDPTNGNVIYVPKENSQDLAYVQEDGTAVIKVDNATNVAPGGNRRSVRITSKATYNNGALVIADFWSFAHGPSVWPAFWLVGPNWPNAGEVDVVEHVNDDTINQYTLHTGSEAICQSNPNVQSKFPSLDSTADKAFLGKVISTECKSSPSNNNGCAFTDVHGSAGTQFNVASGGVFAMLWDNSNIVIWRFERNSVPQDIQNGDPNPESWGTPVALWTEESCNIAASFNNLSLVLNISICGDWAGAVYPGTYGGTCADAVSNSTNYDWAHIKMNYISVYKQA